jgi:hypothetical protein
MPDVSHLTPQAREQALRDYIATAPDRAAAVRLVVEMLDPVADLALLALLEEIAPEEFTTATNH